MSPYLERPASGGHGVLLPDLHGQLVQPLELLADLLTDVQTWSNQQEGVCSTLVLPGMLIAHSTLESIRRLIYLVESTQCRPEGAACVYGPGRREPHTVLAPLQLPSLDVEALSLTARVLGHPALPTPLRNLVTVYAGAGAPTTSGPIPATSWPGWPACSCPARCPPLECSPPGCSSSNAVGSPPC